MKFWTIQPWNVVEIVMQEGIYLPDFDKSAYLRRFIEAGNTDMVGLYRAVLEGYAARNGVALRGVVFGFITMDDNGFIHPIASKAEFDAFMQRKASAVGSLLKTLKGQPDAMLLELEYPDRLFNPPLIDINDFQALMPPLIALPPYDTDELVRLMRDFRAGKNTMPVMPSGVIQAHLPYIDRNSLIGIYPIPQQGDGGNAETEGTDRRAEA